MLNTICMACRHGECDRCQGGQRPPEGMLGGWRCVCDHKSRKKPPALESLWHYPAWNNPDYTGPWRVVSFGQHHPEAEVVADRRIVLERVGVDRHGEHKQTDADLAFWPGGWEPFA